MAYWLLKTEPSVYSFARLVKDGKTVWDGVANNLALIHIRSMRKGDEAIIYHTDEERACAGLATVISAPYADPKENDAKLAVVDVKVGRALTRPVTLAAMKANVQLVGFELFRNSRLSVVPVTAEQWKVILAMSEG
jgi:predicted RNA-binding protein with PUA-like domain